MRKSIIAAVLFISVLQIQAQDSSYHSKDNNGSGIKRNILKWNLSSLALKNYHFTYERGLSKHISLAISYRFMPKGTLPYETEISKAVNSSDINFSQSQVGNTSITPQVNFYMGKGNLKGFYIAPYGRFSTFDISAPISYTTTVNGQNVKTSADFSGKISSSSGGLIFGVQANLSKSIVLDIWLIGAHYGTSTGDLVFVSSTPLTAQEQASLQQNLNNINASPFKFTSTVNANGAEIKSDGPWAGVRGLGFGLGFRF